ncbi:fungal-specific transcription factor domain-containing protein [Aspergillus pseudoustus]|uniref:Fungal-specific transcription factor domain-containing protein n=1 Tax=Aspergillus pseudoustus TaxID=1810923 RepID=A0ABR4IE05_9EURO
MQSTPRNRLKTRTGCIRCKQRKIKCDETVPNCNQCMRRGYDCPGYKKPLKWSAKYEIGRGQAQETPAVSNPTPPEENDLSPYRVADGLDFTIAIDKLCPEFTTEYTDSHTPLSEWLDLATIPAPLEDEDTRMFRYYFTTVCPVNSCFDSAQNFFRLEIGSLTTSCSLIYHAILSMSAAHLAGSRADMAIISLNHKTQAISSLNNEIAQFSENREASSGLALDSTAELLLATVILGMTDGWHTPSSLGITHLHGARILLKKWLSNDGSLDPSSRLGSFVIGVMAYWEAMSAFLINQPLDELSYLDVFTELDEVIPYPPNPWTGICTPLFAYLAKVGTLVRQRSSIQKLACDTGTAAVRDVLDGSLLQHARETETCILSYRPPDPSLVSDTGDIRTPIDHLVQIARIYRWSALLELYRSFPELLEAGARRSTTLQNLLSMATSVLTLITAIPSSSGVTCLLTLPLIIAGSTLQHTSTHHAPTNAEASSGSSWTLLATELSTLPNNPSILNYWRNLVRDQIQAVHRYVGLAAITRGEEILEKVWARADLGRAVDGPETGGQEGKKSSKFVLWTDVMMDERLESIFG